MTFSDFNGKVYIIVLQICRCFLLEMLFQVNKEESNYVEHSSNVLLVVCILLIVIISGEKLTF